MSTPTENGPLSQRRLIMLVAVIIVAGVIIVRSLLGGGGDNTASTQSPSPSATQTIEPNQQAPATTTTQNTTDTASADTEGVPVYSPSATVNLDAAQKDAVLAAAKDFTHQILAVDKEILASKKVPVNADKDLAQPELILNGQAPTMRREAAAKYLTNISASQLGDVMVDNTYFTGDATVKDATYLPKSSKMMGEPIIRVEMKDGAKYYLQFHNPDGNETPQIKYFTSEALFADSELGSLENVPGSQPSIK